MRKRITAIISLFILIQGLAAQVIDQSYLMGELAYENKAYDKAIDYFKQVQASDQLPDDPDLLIGKSYFMAGNTDSALYYLERTKPAYRVKADFWMAKAFAKAGLRKEAIGSLEKHLSNNSHFPPNVIKLDPAFKDFDYDREWRSLWSEEWYSEAERMQFELEYLLQEDDYEALESMFDSMNESLLIQPAIRCLYAIYLYENQQFKESYDYFEESLKNNSYQDVSLMLRISRYYQKMGKNHEALILRKRIQKKNPYLLENVSAMAALEMKAGNQRAALALLDAYNTGNLSSADWLYVKAGVLDGAGEYRQAIQCLTDAIALPGTREEFFNARAEIYYNTSSYHDAYSDYSMSLDYNPRQPDVYFNRGLCRLAYKDYKGACYDFQKAKELGHPDAPDYLIKYCNNK